MPNDTENGASGEIANDKFVQPSLSFEFITFSDDTRLQLNENDIVVFVGPNNAGKSAALRELERCVAKPNPGFVIKSTSIKRRGNAKDLLAFLEKNAQISGVPGSHQYGGIGYNIQHSHIGWFEYEHDRHPVASFFAKRLATETRIQDSNAAPSLALFQQPPTHPIHMLLMDEGIASDVSEKFREAFGVDLTPFRAGGNSFPLYVGEKPTVMRGKDELSLEFVKELQNTNIRLDAQGDGMRSFASVILHILASKTHSIQFLDEPEAFLHPPQARLLGQYIAENRNEKSQLFIATHSADILDGLIEKGSDNIRIVRLRRDGKINRVKELGSKEVQSIAKDTLTRFSGVFNGIFFERVIICESDADCMFYRSILELPSVFRGRKPDVLFVHISGKHRMEKLATTLRALDVPVSVIADIDVLSEENTFKKLFESLGGQWADIRANWKSVSNTVISQRPPLNAEQVAGMIRQCIDDVSGTDEFPLEKVKAIKKIFDTVSPWKALKQSGPSALPNRLLRNPCL